MTDAEYIKNAWRANQPQSGRPPTFFNPFPGSNSAPVDEKGARLAREFLKNGPRMFRDWKPPGN